MTKKIKEKAVPRVSSMNKKVVPHDRTISREKVDQHDSSIMEIGEGRPPKEKHQEKAIPHASSIKEKAVLHKRGIKKAVPHVSSIKEKAISNKRSIRPPCYQHKGKGCLPRKKEKVVPQESCIKEKSVPTVAKLGRRPSPSKAALGPQRQHHQAEGRPEGEVGYL